MKYKVILHRSEEGIAISCPVLPGCWSQGDTEKEALDNIRDAISEYLRVMYEPQSAQRNTENIQD